MSIKTFAQLEEEVERELEQEREQRAAARAARKAFLEKLFGSTDRLDWQQPDAIADYDALLARHAAQLRNAIDYTMGEALSDDLPNKLRAATVNALTRMIQTNVAIAKVQHDASAKISKTVHGGGERKEPQD